MDKKNINCDILIIGAGLTGLYLAYLLRDSRLNVHIAEARDRIGGRIQTNYSSPTDPIEMGATWLGEKHTKLIQLLKELDIGIFEQKIGNKAIYEAMSLSPHTLVDLPPNPEPSLRIRGGTANLINQLASHLETEQIHLKKVVTAITHKKDYVEVRTKNRIFKTKKVISTLPPNLLFSTIEFTPNLPAEIVNIAQKTHTWMGESIKIGLTYKEPFWKKTGLSGTIFSNVGPIPEMYDHSNYEESYYVLKGFFNGNYFSVTRGERLALVMKQLKKYYGIQAGNYIAYDEVVWRNEPYTFAPYTDHILPHQNNGHQVYRKSYFEEKLIIAGTETATRHPGYMEGAIQSAEDVSELLSNLI